MCREELGPFRDCCLLCVDGVNFLPFQRRNIYLRGHWAFITMPLRVNIVHYYNSDLALFLAAERSQVRLTMGWTQCLGPHQRCAGFNITGTSQTVLSTRSLLLIDIIRNTLLSGLSWWTTCFDRTGWSSSGFIRKMYLSQSTYLMQILSQL
jgi:hypothetical protein